MLRIQPGVLKLAKQTLKTNLQCKFYDAGHVRASVSLKSLKSQIKSLHDQVRIGQ